MSKWEKFASSYSPVEINNPNTKGGKLDADWSRESYQNRMTINGIPLKNFADIANSILIDRLRCFISFAVLGVKPKWISHLKLNLL